MGVPVVTLAGPARGPGYRHVARTGVSLLSNVGLPELVAATQADYVRIATGLARDSLSLANRRSRLRTQVIDSPVREDAVLTARLEAAFARM